jgi:hypothetical protein
MKNLLLTINLVMLCLAATAQGDCNCDFKNTLGAHYNYSRGTNGVGLEYGKTGDESNFSIHVGLDMFFPHNISKGKSTADPDTVMTARMYNKIGYRVLRIPYQLSVYADLFGGLDMSRGLFYAVGLKFLHPMNENAISVEPYYMPGRNGGWTIQAGFHIHI